jgi:tetratricopeptide (TPR) repeat protein
MTRNPDRLSRFWNELKRRKTDRVLVVYAATAFTILQLEPVLETAFFLPSSTSTILIIVFAAGFPVAALLSWFFDITPGGIEKTKPLKASERRRIQSELKRWRYITLVSIIVIVLLVLFNIIRSRIDIYEIKRSEKTIAVLPFENLNPDSTMPIPADLVTSLISTGLSQIPEFTVCSGFNVLANLNRNRPVPEIARKLGVYFIVTGKMARNRDITLIYVNLLNKKGNIIWGREYKLYREDDLEKLTEIPLLIAGSLKTSLSTAVKRKLDRKLTGAPAAYLNYMKANAIQDLASEVSDYVSKGDSTFNDLCSTRKFEEALNFYDKAIAIDSGFALAYAKRAITRAIGYKAEHFTLKDQMARCREDIEHALFIDRGLTEAKVAYGFYYYYFETDYDKALEYFREASTEDPEYWQCKYYMGLVLRAKGEWAGSQNLMNEVVRSNPLNAVFITNIGISYHFLHKYDSAVYFHDRAIRLMPGWTDAYQNKFESLIARDGNTRAAGALIDTAAARTKGGNFRKNRILLDLYNGKFNDALSKATVSAPSEFSSPGEKYMIFGEIYRHLKTNDLANNYFSLALEFFENKVAENPGRPQLLSYVGIASAGLGERLKALEAGQKAIELTGQNMLERKERILDLARIYVILGDHEKCTDLLEDLIYTPSDLSCSVLRLDPDWKALRNYPEFARLLSECTNK